MKINDAVKQRIFKTIYKHKSKLIHIGILTMMVAVAQAFLPYFVGQITEQLSVINAGDTTLVVVTLVGIWLVFSLTTIIFEFFRQRLELLLARYLAYEYLDDSLRHLFYLPIDFFGSVKTGELFSRLQKGSDALDILIGRTLVRLAPDGITILFGLVVTFSLSYQIGFILLGGIIVYGFVNWNSYYTLFKIRRKEQNIQAQTHGGVTDRVYNIPLIKEQHGEEYALSWINTQLFKERYGVRREFIYAWSKTHLIRKVLLLVIEAIMYMYGGYLLTKGIVSLGSVIALVGYFRLTSRPLIQLASNYEQFQDGIIGLEVSEKVRNIKTEHNTKNSKSPEVFVPEIIFDNVSFEYSPDKYEYIFEEESKQKQKQNLNISLDLKNKNAFGLRNIYLTVAPGTTVAFVGRSGAGKSTLLQLVSGFLHPSSGKVLVGGVSTVDWDIHKLRDSIAIVPQEHVLLNDTLKENILLGKPFATDSEITDALAHAHVTEFLKQLPDGIYTKVGERGVRLSGGQKQRVALARAFIRDPKILILDEPTSALDAENEHLLSQSLASLMKNRTTLIVAHRLSTVKSADMIVVVDAGQIVEKGTHQELLKKEGLYAHLHSVNEFVE